MRCLRPKVGGFDSNPVYHWFFEVEVEVADLRRAPRSDTELSRNTLRV